MRPERSTSSELQKSVGQRELAEQRLRELHEGVRQDDDLGPAAEPGEEVERAVQRLHGADHGLDVGQAEVMLVENREAAAHELVVVGLVTRRAPQRRDAGALGDVDPDLRDEDALEVEAGDHSRGP